MKAVNVDDVLKILYKYGEYIFVTDEKKYSSMIDEIANLKALEPEPILDKIRAEIEQIYDDIDTVSHNEYENAVEQGKERAYENVLDIIDKYKAESEDTE